MTTVKVQTTPKAQKTPEAPVSEQAPEAPVSAQALETPTALESTISEVDKLLAQVKSEYKAKVKAVRQSHGIVEKEDRKAREVAITQQAASDFFTTVNEQLKKELNRNATGITLRIILSKDGLKTYKVKVYTRKIKAV